MNSEMSLDDCRSAVTLGQQILSLASSAIKQTTSYFSCRLLEEISLHQVLQHSSTRDCWVIIYDKVYDVTRFISQHPGGYDIMMEQAGRDATLAFRSVLHSDSAISDLDNYLIGVLPPNERIYS